MMAFSVPPVACCACTDATLNSDSKPTRHNACVCFMDFPLLFSLLENLPMQLHASAAPLSIESYRLPYKTRHTPVSLSGILQNWRQALTEIHIADFPLAADRCRPHGRMRPSASRQCNQLFYFAAASRAPLPCPSPGMRPRFRAPSY